MVLKVTSLQDKNSAQPCNIRYNLPSLQLTLIIPGFLTNKDFVIVLLVLDYIVFSVHKQKITKRKKKNILKKRKSLTVLLHKKKSNQI